jgi:hypothetical protein
MVNCIFSLFHSFGSFSSGKKLQCSLDLRKSLVPGNQSLVLDSGWYQIGIFMK